MAILLQKEVATLAGGCFWCLEAVYVQLIGVDSVESGYMGGHQPSPTYKDICTGTTGYAEVIQLTFNSTVISFREILEVFFAIHNPTTLNRQGNDIGTQYRSVIFYHSLEQKTTAEKIIGTLTNEKIFNLPIVTAVVPSETFYIAESYHQKYFARNPSQPYCLYLIEPKIAQFRRQFSTKLKS